MHAPGVPAGCANCYFIVQCTNPLISLEPALKSQSISAAVRMESRVVLANFRVATGRLRVTEGSTIVDDIYPPDSWLALASLN